MYSQEAAYSVPGPTRMLTRLDLRLAKRGSGRPVALFVTAWALASLAWTTVNPAARANIVAMICLETRLKAIAMRCLCSDI